MNFAILQGWIEANPVLAKLALVPERRDPILLPTDRDIALVMERAPGMVGQMMRAALVTGAREDELAKAKRIDIDHARRQLTIVGKRNKLRVIDLAPFGGYEFFAALPAYVGKPFLFWHDDGARYASFAPTFDKLMNRIEAWAKANGVEFRRFAFHHLRHRHAVDWLKSGRDIYTLQGRLGHTSRQDHGDVSRLPDAGGSAGRQVRLGGKAGQAISMNDDAKFAKAHQAIGHYFSAFSELERELGEAVKVVLHLETHDAADIVVAALRYPSMKASLVRAAAEIGRRRMGPKLRRNGRRRRTTRSKTSSNTAKAAVILLHTRICSLGKTARST